MVALVTIVCLVLVVYTYFGYPLLVFGLSRLFPRPARQDPRFLPTVSVCIPVYNVANHLRAKVASLCALDYPAEKLEVLLYSDGSTDGTRELAERLAAEDGRIRVLGSAERRGKPTALNAMVAAARGEVLVLTDARQPLVPGALRALVAPLADPSVGCVSGNLVLQGGAGAGVYWRYENAIREAEGRFRGMVGVTGPLYAVRRDDVDPLPEDTILDDMFIPMRLYFRDRRVVFAKDAVAYDEAFGDEREFGRKARTLAGNYQLFARMPALLLPLRYGLWFELASHKLLRLACPWLLGLLAAATLLGLGETAEPWPRRAFQLLAVGQVVFYLLALGGSFAGRLGQVARTFVVLNWAAIVGLGRFLRRTQRVTW